MAITSHKIIAERLGIDRVTVSLALKNSDRVALKTRDRVHEVAAELGYSQWSNRGAREMASRGWNKSVRTGVIVIVSLNNASEPSMLRAPYFDAYMRGIEAEAAERDLSILICPHKPGRLPGIVSSGGMDGVITFSVNSDQMALFHEIEKPIISLGEWSTSSSDIAVTPDQGEGMRLAAQHLLSLGHSRIAYMGHTLDFRNSVLRFEGYRKAMTDAGLFDERFVYAELNGHGEAYHDIVIRALWEKSGGFTALVCYHDVFAMGAVRALERMGLRVPADVSVTGFDDITTDFHFAPAVSSVHYDRVAMGRHAVRIIEGETGSESQVYPVEFEARDSTQEIASAAAS